MPRPREIPYNTDWLRRYLKKRLALELPLYATDEQIREVCGQVTQYHWKRLQGAWRRHRNHQNPQWMIEWNRMREERKSLGDLWRRVIAMGLCTEENALVLAEHITGNLKIGYSDVGCRAVLSEVCRQAAEQCGQSPFSPVNTKFLGSVKAYYCQLKCDSEAIAERMDCDVEQVEAALSELRRLGHIESEDDAE